MKNRSLQIGAVCAVALVLVLPWVASACFITYPTFHVGQSFRARVTDRGRPVAGLRLALRLESKGDTIYALTDASGRAQFSNLKAGRFVLTADHDADSIDGAAIDVETNRGDDVTVPLKWPSVAPLRARSIAGVIRTPDYYPTQVQVPLSLSLVEGISGRPIATVLADRRGSFAFAGRISSGLYFLRLNPSGLRDFAGNEIEGMFAVEVDSAAPSDKLDIDIGWTDCGLLAEQRERRSEKKVSTICGDVADETGGAISNSGVLLFDSAGTDVLEQVRSDTVGRFALREQVAGAYQLVVKAPGFLPVSVQIRVEPQSGLSGCSEPIHVRPHPQ